MGADKDKTLIPSWVQEAMANETGEKRRQPWKDTFGDTVDKELGDDPEVVSTEKEGCGGEAWSVMGQTLAA